MSVSHEQEQSGHGREVDPADIEFEMWWDRDLGWGGERLTEYQLAREAFKFGMRIAGLEAREQWVSVEGGDLPPYGEPVLLKIKGVVQHNLYMRDAADDTPDWWECTVDQDTTKWVESTDEWMPLPTPPTEGEG